jgi:hypothetical protein
MEVKFNVTWSIQKMNVMKTGIIFYYTVMKLNLPQPYITQGLAIESNVKA